MVSGYHWLVGSQSCGCFGGIKVPPAATFGFDIAALVWFAAPIFGMRRDPRPTRAPFALIRLSPLRAVTAFSLGFIVSVMTLLAVGPVSRARAPASGTIVFDPSSWPGNQLPLFQYIIGSDRSTLMVGRRTVVLVDRTCDACREHLRTMHGRAGASAVWIVDLAPPEAAPDPQFNDNFNVLKLRPDVRYAADVPMEVSLNNGIVVSVRR